MKERRAAASSSMKGKRATIWLVIAFDLCNPRWRRMCKWSVFACTHLISGASAVSLVPRPEDRRSDRSQAPPSSPSLFCTGMRGGGWERGYISLARLPQQLHKQHGLLSLLSWAYSACVLFALLFQQCSVLSRSILSFSFRLLCCLRSPSWVTSGCAISTTPEPSLQKLPYQLPLRFTLGTWL